MNDLELGVIGNCSIGALLDRRARIVWACMPRFDGDPAFSALLDPGAKAGFYEVELIGFRRSEQAYLRNSAIVRTTLFDDSGGAVEVTDFAPRFRRFGRLFRPMTLVRLVRPVSGYPRVRIRLKPLCDYGSRQPELTRGSNHVRYVMPHLTLRLTTDAPVGYVVEEVPFHLEMPLTLILGADEILTAPIAETGRAFLEQTHEYWREWVRYLALPFEWQDAVIRAAITLKLCNHEETGAIVAALTTSIPEAPGTPRTWDYRCCWLRDSNFAVRALNRLGATLTMEGYFRYINNIVAASDNGYLQPVFGLNQERRLDERVIDSLPGYRGMGPVRVGNHAFAQVQNDGYGSVILALTQSFFDGRVEHPGDASVFRRLEILGEQAIKRWDQPDAGLWEYRNRTAAHSFSAVMCWAACDRLGRIARHLGLEARAAYWREQAAHIRDGVLDAAFNRQINSFTSTLGGDDVDASLLLLAELGFVPARDPRFLGTLALVERRMRRGSHLLRYAGPDDFGTPTTTFTICTIWYIDALAQTGRIDEARELFEIVLAARNSLGLLSEDLDPERNELWGNFPQTYSMVGIINAAMRLSKPWEEAI